MAKVPLMLLTVNAIPKVPMFAWLQQPKQSWAKVIKILNMRAIKTIRMSLDKIIVKYNIEKAKGVFLWGDVDQDQWTKITQIIVY